MDRLHPRHSPGEEGQARVRNGPPRSRSHRPRLFALMAFVVVGLFDLIFLARSLSQPERPGLFERPPARLPREQILDDVRFLVGIQNLALTFTLLGGYWVLLKWRQGSARPFVAFIALSLLPVAAIAIILFIYMLRMIIGVRV